VFAAPNGQTVFVVREGRADGSGCARQRVGSQLKPYRGSQNLHLHEVKVLSDAVCGAESAAGPACLAGWPFLLTRVSLMR